MLSEDFLRHVLAHPLQYSDGCAALAREVLRLRALSEPVWGDEQSEAIQSVESSGPMPTDRTKIISVLSSIEQDMRDDATAFDGRPFNGKTVAEYFGNQGAAIAALSRLLREFIEEAPDGR